MEADSVLVHGLPVGSQRAEQGEPGQELPQDSGHAGPRQKESSAVEDVRVETWQEQEARGRQMGGGESRSRSPRAGGAKVEQVEASQKDQGATSIVSSMTAVLKKHSQHSPAKVPSQIVSVLQASMG
mmetsp:Transcript_37443/g.69193  ORF Transcript_37443/g.69193 Transcript_37443/m.69193 type:complete len:127 (-) Transcript_37443:26-406(-)